MSHSCGNEPLRGPLPPFAKADCASCSELLPIPREPAGPNFIDNSPGRVSGGISEIREKQMVSTLIIVAASIVFSIVVVVVVLRQTGVFGPRKRVIASGQQGQA